MGNGQKLSGVRCILGHDLHHFGQGLFYTHSLPTFIDLTFRRCAHKKFDTQGTGDHGLETGQTPIFTQVVQRFQHKHSGHFRTKSGGLAYDGLKGESFGGQLSDLQRQKHLARRGGAGVKNVDTSLRVLLQPELAGLLRAVVRAGKKS